MSDRIGSLHRFWLWACLVLLGALGVIFLVAPGALIDQLGVDASERLTGILRLASSVLIAEAVIVGFAIRSDSWSETRLIT